jgi:acetylornithine deacetylase/succinyl-diaminopimelate desuccinylase-like protein
MNPLKFTTLLFILSCTLSAQDIKHLTHEHITENGHQIIADFSSLLSMPNVAYDLPNINRNADYLKGELEKRGVQTRLLRMIGTPPIVFGYLPAKNAETTIAFYVHYDGQPVDTTHWTHSPWKPTYYDKAIWDGGKPIAFPKKGDTIDPENRIYARSAGDDKAPIIGLLTALDIINQNKLRLKSNIVFFFEGQEEAGSMQLQRYLEDNKQLVDEIDIWLFCDGPVHQSRLPQLVYGVRGITSMELTVYGPNRSLHSGHYGNWAPVPGQMLAQLLASMKDEEGNVLVEGYYDSIDPIGELEKAALEAAPEMDEVIKRELGLVETEGDESLNERLLLPSLNVRGLSSGGVGDMARNIVPSTATASLDMRLVKGNNPEKMQELIEAHIRKRGYHIVREDPDQQTRLTYPKIIKVTREEGYPAARTPMDEPMTRKVVERAKLVTGEELILLPTLGGSLPLHLFTDVLKKPAIIVPVANHDNNQHAEDENIRIANLWYSVELMTALLTI